jgi:20S proteasome alpha/beta subunit
MAKNICYYNEDTLSAANICTGDASIYSIPFGAVIIEQPLALCSGSGSTYIVGFCEAACRKDMQYSE